MSTPKPKRPPAKPAAVDPVESYGGESDDLRQTLLAALVKYDAARGWPDLPNARDDIKTVLRQFTKPAAMVTTPDRAKRFLMLQTRGRADREGELVIGTIREARRRGWTT